MARIGLEGLRYALITDEGDADTAPTYDAPAVIGKAVDAKMNLELNTAELYADNSLAESDTTFNKGTLDLTIADDDDATLAALLGRTIDATRGIVRKNNDVAPYVGVGRILTKIVNGAYKYKAEFLVKVKFTDTVPEEKTKGESVEFQTVPLSGAVSTAPNGEWSSTKTFPTRAEAVAYLDACFGVEEA